MIRTIRVNTVERIVSRAAQRGDVDTTTLADGAGGRE